jgi:hypothetical protein
VRDGLPNELGGCAHWRECYDANGDGSTQSQYRSSTER